MPTVYGDHLAPPTLPTGTTPAWRIAAGLPGPGVAAVSIADLGILRDVTEDDQGRVHVQVTPTHPDCPAVDAISTDLVEALADAGYQHVDVELVLTPPWSIEWMSEGARATLATVLASHPAQLGACCPCRTPVGRTRTP